MGWIMVIAASCVSGGVLLGMNISEFLDSTVSFNLESPTTPLTEVFYPSVVVCNMNAMRKSLVHYLLRDPSLSGVSYRELQNVLANNFIEGKESNASNSAREDDLIERVLTSERYDALFQELVDFSYSNESSIGHNGLPTTKWHSLQDADMSEENLANVKRLAVVELASQV